MAKSSSGRYSRFPAVNRTAGISAPDADAVLAAAKKVGETPVKVAPKAPQKASVEEPKDVTSNADNGEAVDGDDKTKRRTRKRKDS